MTEMVNSSHHDKTTIRQACALSAKLTALNETARACGIGLRMKLGCEGRMEAGHREAVAAALARVRERQGELQNPVFAARNSVWKLAEG